MSYEYSSILVQSCKDNNKYFLFIYKTLKEFLLKHSDEVQFDMANTLINSFVTIRNSENSHEKLCFIRRFSFGSIEDNVTSIDENKEPDSPTILNQLINIISKSEEIKENRKKNDVKMRKCETENIAPNTKQNDPSEEYINFTTTLSLYFFMKNDNNPLEETYIYSNNKLESYIGEDTENLKIWTDMYKDCKKETRELDNEVLNISRDYFDKEFNMLNIFIMKNNQDMKYGDFIKKLWLTNSSNKDHNKIEPFLSLIISKMKLLDKFVKKNKPSSNCSFSRFIQKEIDIDFELRLILGDLEVEFGTSNDTSFCALRDTGVFLKLNLIFLCLLERTMAVDKAPNKLRFCDKSLKKYTSMTKIIDCFENSLHNKYKIQSKNKKYNLFMDYVKGKDIMFGIKMRLFNIIFADFLNRHYFNYKLTPNSLFRDTVDHISKLIENFDPDRFRIEDKSLIDMNRVADYSYSSDIYNLIIFDKIGLV